jgi:EF hand
MGQCARNRLLSSTCCLQLGVQGCRFAWVLTVSGARRDRDSAPNSQLLVVHSFGDFFLYVSAREKSLRRTFDAFDRDGDGKLDIGELAAGLALFRYDCPRSRCVYKTRREASAAMEPDEVVGRESANPVQARLCIETAEAPWGPCQHFKCDSCLTWI